MSRIEILLAVAGILQLVIAAANLVLPRILQYRENLAPVSPMIRQIFLVHSGYIVLVLVGFGIVSIVFASELAGGSGLGRFVSGFLAVFWLLRVPVQLRYDPVIRRRYRLVDVAFLLAVLYLGATYLSAALEIWR
jgi:hypothetical protein